MIDHATIDRILEAAQIEQVIGEYVSLKRRGANYIACCPFHNEKTPSFSVSPSKGIFKCFGCGKAGNVVGFIMEHEQLSYVEALKFLGNKYHIPIDDEPETAEEAQNRMRRDSMLIVNDFAQKFYTQYLWEDPVGQSIGLSYFRERGFTDAIIHQFQLGYAPNKRDLLSNAALSAGYKLDYLTATGLSIHYPAQDGKRETTIDRYQDRVIFPIHSLSGRIIAFGGRTLRTDKSLAKYINSPESEVYIKSRSLYGIYFAKQHITRLQKCYLVEGYTDVISFVQAGIQNVVASSGTSLTTEQIRLIKRFTPLVTVLYDGDNAGIKASIRGIDMLLEEGLQVKVVRFPDGDDPDSFARTHSAKETQDFLDSKETDFIHFKIALMADEMADPLKRSGLIREVMTSIAIIPDAITRSVYIEECSRHLEIDEKLLTREVARLRKKSLERRFVGASSSASTIPAGAERFDHVPLPQETPESFSEPSAEVTASQPNGSGTSSGIQELIQAERDILYYLIKFGQSALEETTVATFIQSALAQDDLTFSNPFLETLYQLYFTLHGDDETRRKELINHNNTEVSLYVLNLLSNPHPLLVKSLRESLPVEESQLPQYVSKAVLVYKSMVVTRACTQLTYEIQRAQILGDAQLVADTIKKLQMMTTVRKSFAKELKRLN